MHSNVARDEWMLEVERVGHKLKINKNAGDGKEWRAHMDQTKKFHDSVKTNLPEVRGKLERLSEDVSNALEKIAKNVGFKIIHTEHIGWGVPIWKADPIFRKYKILDDIFEIIGKKLFYKQATSLYVILKKE